MKLARWLFISATFAFLLSWQSASGQNVTKTSQPQDPFQKIDRAYRQGKINLDQKVLYKFYTARSKNSLPDDYHLEKNTVLKCGTGAISDFQNNRAKLLQTSVNDIERMMQSPGTQASQSYISPSGRFRVHYETTGPDAVPAGDSDGDGTPDYVEWTAEAADSSWSHEVGTLGYTDPIVNGLYEIYIEIPFFGENTYGETHLGSYKGSGDATVIVINNELDEERFHVNTDDNQTHGAIKVTVAHEFKHAIQYEANQWLGETGNWLEMDATLMEEVVYDDVNDYYNYITSSESIFSNPENSFYPGSYFHITWALFYEEQYGSQFWVDVWNAIKANPNIAMVDAMAQTLGGSQAFDKSYINSQLWHYASGPGNSSPNFGFEESTKYPDPPVSSNKSLLTENFTIPRPAPLSSPSGFAAKYYQISPQTGLSGNVRLELDASGSNTGVGIIAYNKDGSVQTTTISLSGSTQTMQIPNVNWESVNKLGVILANSSTSSSNNSPIFVGVGSNDFDNTLSQNYPNPFNPTTQIRFTLEETSQVKLKVYDISGRLIQTLIDEQLSAGLYEPTFDGSRLASGVYIYQLKTGTQSTVKKMTLVK